MQAHDYIRSTNQNDTKKALPFSKKEKNKKKTNEPEIWKRAKQK